MTNDIETEEQPKEEAVFASSSNDFFGSGFLRESVGERNKMGRAIFSASGISFPDISTTPICNNFYKIAGNFV